MLVGLYRYVPPNGALWMTLNGVHPPNRRQWLQGARPHSHWLPEDNFLGYVVVQGGKAVPKVLFDQTLASQFTFVS